MPKVYFSPQDDCVAAIRGFIGRSLKSLDICVFTITDNRIAKEIENAAERGVKVRLISDNEKSYDRGSDVYELSQSRKIEVKLDTSHFHMHHKFAISDARVLLNGSYNWTRSAAENNEENLILEEDQDLIQRFLKEFERLWEKYPPF